MRNEIVAALVAVACLAGCGGLVDASGADASADAPDGHVSRDSGRLDTSAPDVRPDADSAAPEPCPDSGDGTSGPIVLASEQSAPNAIAVNATGVYWTNFSDGGTVMSVPLCGGATTTLASGQAEPLGIAVDSENVYWTDYGNACSSSPACRGSVMKLPLAGGTPTTLASGRVGPTWIAVDATNVYWADDPLAQKVPLGGGTPTLVYIVKYPVVIAVAGISIFWTGPEPEGSGFQVLQGPLSGDGMVVALASRQGTPNGLAVDDTSVYWGSEVLDGGTPAGGALMKADQGGGTLVTLVSTHREPTWVAADGTSVYWTSAEDGTVMRVPRGGGTVATLASGQAGPGFITVDATSIYWANDSTVMKLTK